MKMKLTVLCLAAFFLTYQGAIAATTLTLNNTSYSQNFNGLGASLGAFNLPGWGVTGAGGGGTTVNYATLAGSSTTVAASSGTPSTGGIYNWGNGTTTTDRALGFMTSGSYASPNGIVFGFTNNLGSTITDLSLGFDYERYRINTAAASVAFLTSTNGTSWTANTAGDSGAFTTATSAHNFTTGTVVSKSGVALTGLSIASGSSFYFQWNFNTTGTNSQGLGLDNFTLSATAGPPISGNFWDGNGASLGGGGDGIWSSSSNTFATDASGSNGGLPQGSGTIVFGGTLGAVGVNSTVSANSGITFSTTGYVLSGGTAVNLGGASASLNALTTGTNVTATVATDISGSGGMSKAGSGILVLTGNKSYTGGTTISAGILQLGDGTTDGNLASGSAIINNATLAVNNSSAQTLSGVISGSGMLTKAGAGTLTLSGPNTYTGATSVTAGILAINGNQTLAIGAVSVTGTNTRLQGTGTIGGNTTISSLAVHSAGNGVGKQTFDKVDPATTSLTYGSGSVFEWELASTPAETAITDPTTYASNRGLAYDAVNVTGTLGGNSSAFRVLLNGTQTFADAFWNQDRTWTDIFRTGDGTGTSNQNFASIFSGFEYFNSTGSVGNINTTGRSFTASGSTLTWSAVPEPSSVLAGLLLGAGLLRRRRGV